MWLMTPKGNQEKITILPRNLGIWWDQWWGDDLDLRNNLFCLVGSEWKYPATCRCWWFWVLKRISNDAHTQKPWHGGNILTLNKTGRWPADSGGTEQQTVLIGFAKTQSWRGLEDWRNVLFFCHQQYPQNPRNCSAFYDPSWAGSVQWRSNFLRLECGSIWFCTERGIFTMSILTRKMMMKHAMLGALSYPSLRQTYAQEPSTHFNPHIGCVFHDKPCNVGGARVRFWIRFHSQTQAKGLHAVACGASTIVLSSEDVCLLMWQCIKILDFPKWSVDKLKITDRFKNPSTRGLCI